MSTWSLHGNGKTVTPGEVVAPNERLSWPRTIGIGVQHIAAMFGATFLVPILTGFPTTTTLLFSGIGTLVFVFITRNRIPSYLGSSFAFLGNSGQRDQPAWRLARRSESSSVPSTTASVSSGSIGRVARVPSTSSQTRPTAIPKTPCPPRTRSMTSSGEVQA